MRWGRLGAILPVDGRRQLIRSSLALALLACAGGAACAERLDKAACGALSVELADMLAGGVKTDMERGPEWAGSNLPRERLESIKRLIEVEALLEFRCGKSRSGVVATKPGRAPEDVEAPERKLPGDSPANIKAAEPAPVPVPSPVRTVETADIVEPPEKPAKEQAPAAAAALTPAEKSSVAEEKAEEKEREEKKEEKTAPAESTAAVAPEPAAKPAPDKKPSPSAATASPTPAKATPSTRKSRARPPRGYVSPQDVNPTFLTHSGSP